MKFISDIAVRAVQQVGGDYMVAAAARVSTSGEEALKLADPAAAEECRGLINYLVKQRHGTPFEHSSITFFVHAPIFVWREWHRHRIGFCIAGDTNIYLESYAANSGRTLRRRTIADLWKHWHVGVTDKAHVRKAVAAGYTTAVAERTRMLPSCRTFTCRVLNEQTQFFELGRPVDIIATGIKEAWLLKTVSGHELKCSADHRILTRAGWAKLSELDGSEHIAVCGKRSLYAERRIPPSLRQGIGVWTTMQRSRLIREIDNCYVCGVERSREDLILDHVVPVAADLLRALDTANLKPICADCHRIKTDSEQMLGRRANIAGSKFVALAGRPHRVGEVEMFDLCMEPPHHNFVANGIVVHNSYNEESGRYKTLDPIFYIPPRDRPMMKVDGWKPGRPKFLTLNEHFSIDRPEAPDNFYREFCERKKKQYASAYESYEWALSQGVDPGLARIDLPVGIYSSCWVTCNPRSLMAFLSLRTHEPEAKAVSYPLYEIEVAARAVEKIFAEGWPITYRAFCENGRVAP